MTEETTTETAPITTFGQYDTYTNHLAALNLANPGLFLGFLAWYTVPESVSISHTDLLELVVSSGVSVTGRIAGRLVPPKPGDIFLRGCTTVERYRTKMPSNQPNTYINYLIRKAGSGEDQVCRQVVRETVDGDNHQLDFEVLGDIRYNKKSYSIDARPNTLGLADPEFEGIVADIKQFQSDKECVMTSYNVREVIRLSLEYNMQAISVRSAGGVYFVNALMAEELQAIEKVAAAVNGVTFNVMPLIDDANQRAMVKSAYESDSVGELQRLMNEVQELGSKAKKPTTKQLVAFQTRYSELRARTVAYSELLDDSLGTADASLQLCSLSIQGLIAKAARDELETAEKEV